MLDNDEMATAIRQAIDASGKTQKEIADAFRVTEQAVSGWLRTGKVDKRKLPALAALTGKPLSHFGMGDPDQPVAHAATPAGYVRFDLFEGAAGMGTGVANSDYPEVIRTLDIAEWEIRKKLGFLPAPGRMRLITGRGPSMRPKIEDGDVVMVDTTVTYFDGDDYYLISVDGETQIKMLQKRTDGLYVVSSNPDFREWRISADELIVCGKALIGLGLRRL